jgi:hypothetical protein
LTRRFGWRGQVVFLLALAVLGALRDYRWDIGIIRSKTPPIPNTYLIGVPIGHNDPASSSPPVLLTK